MKLVSTKGVKVILTPEPRVGSRKLRAQGPEDFNEDSRRLVWGFLSLPPYPPPGLLLQQAGAFGAGLS